MRRSRKGKRRRSLREKLKAIQNKEGITRAEAIELHFSRRPARITS